MWRIASERIPLDLDGPSVEVERIHAPSIQLEGTALLSRYVAADTAEGEYTALSRVYELFVVESQPQWDIADHLGPVPLTARGMMRLPIELGLPIVSQWLQSYAAPVAEAAVEEPQSAVDAVIAPGAGRDELKRRLRAVKRRNASKAA